MPPKAMITGRREPGATGEFAQRLVRWQLREGRHDLPWQGSRDPYRVWVSEIMLQQTQVSTVVPYYERFVARFPDVGALACAPLEAVLGAWSGLGYYARARHLHAAARRVVEAGGFPRRREALQALPGVGRSTAAAIAVFAFGERAAILDGNVKRVLARCFGVEGWPGQAAVQARLWSLADSLLPQAHVEAYTQGLMDLVATRCARRSPLCAGCPLEGLCAARREGRQHELPGARPRRTVPRRSRRFLVLLDGDRVMLEQRPPAGLWGGLLSLPEIDEAQDEPLGRWGLSGEGVPLPPLRHAFTHFELEMRPLLFRVSGARALAAPGPMRWVPLGALADAPLPAPVRRLLEGVSVA